MVLRVLIISFVIFLNQIHSQAQLNVTFRYIERPEDDFLRVFVPGEMNSGGPNSGGFISPTAIS